MACARRRGAGLVAPEELERVRLDQAGVVRPGVNPTLAAKMLFGALDEMATNWMLSRRRASLDGVADAVVDVFVHGVGVPAGAGPAAAGGPRS